MIDFTGVKAITIPEGAVKKIMRGADVLWEKVTGRIPSAYQEVEYLKAKGQAYIDLGFAFDTKAKVYLAQIVETIGSSSEVGYSFGAAESSGKLRCMITSPYQGVASCYGSTGSSYLATQVDIIQNSLNEFELILEKGKMKWTNLTSGKTVTNTTQATYTMTSNLYLFAQNYNGSVRIGEHRILKALKYWDKNDTLICDLVPCYRKSDGTNGMYDAARNLFFTNVASSGGFERGGSVLNIKNWVRYSTEADLKTIYNNGLGYKDKTRVRSGGLEAENEYGTATGYIPYMKGDILRIYPHFDGDNALNAINFYDKSLTVLGQFTDAGAYYGFCNSQFKTTIVNGVSVLDISNVTVSGVDDVAFVRVTNRLYEIVSGVEMIITVNEEITS